MKLPLNDQTSELKRKKILIYYLIYCIQYPYSIQIKALRYNLLCLLSFRLATFDILLSLAILVEANIFVTLKYGD